MPTIVTRPFPADLRLLTALRALAAMLVVVYHFGARTASPSLLHTTLIDRGGLGVDIFFVLSGFILAHVYLARAATGRFALRPFLVNRFARLYPMHVLMIAAIIANGLLARHHGQPVEIYGPQIGIDPATGAGFGWNMLTNLALLHAWGTNNAHYFNAVSWSISAEAFAYLLFPAIAAAALWFGNRSWLRLLAALTLYAACQSLAHGLLGKSLYDLSWNWGILRVLPEFALGVATYGLGTAKALPALHLRWLLPLVVALTFGLMAAGAQIELLPPAFAAVILLLAACERELLMPPEWILRPLVYLGEISYSTYMVHLLVGSIYLNMMARLTHTDPQALPSALALSAIIPVVLVSSICFHAIEQPGRRLIRAAFGRLGQHKSTVTA